ncbi:MAG: hypothetical protein M0R03_06275 [Novosphingobium sp.]|nr:hypothetical protein [Novosphingobium sp.]
MTDRRVKFDWKRIERISELPFDNDIRNEIENNFSWFKLRSEDYADGVSSDEFANARNALGALSRTKFSRFQIEPIENEITTVLWFLEVMSQLPSEREVNAKYFLYSRIWNCIGKAGVKLTLGKGIPNHRLSDAQKVFGEICSEGGMGFVSDQALADALKRALKAVSTTGAK